MHKDTIKPLYAKIAEGIWVGNINATLELDFAANDITAVINLSGKYLTFTSDDIDNFDYALPNQELMDIEFPKTLTKLDVIASDIADLRANNRNILVQCYDGRNKSILAVGYYLISKCNKRPDSVVDLLEQIYFDDDQKRAEQEAKVADMSRFIPDDMSKGTAMSLDLNIAQMREERNAIRCLTFASFKKILRVKSHK